MVSSKAAWVLCASALMHQFAVADTVYNWNFDTPWSDNQVTDSTGAGLVLGPRGTVNGSGQTVRNSTTMTFGNAAAYGGSGGVAVLTNGAESQNLFSGINLKLTNVNTASFSSLVDRANNPFMQVDIWSTGESTTFLNQQFYSNTITTGLGNSFQSVGPQGQVVVNGWNTYRMELHNDGALYKYLNGQQIGVASGIQKLTDINNGSLGMLFTTPSVVIDNFKIGVVSPVPEPETYAMLLTGLAIMGVIAKRRKSRQA